MTLIVSISGAESVWMLADRRLSFAGGQTLDEAKKIFCLETDDGLALFGYAGLGRTALGMEPSEWMSNVFRGRSGTLEQCASHLARIASAEIPHHLRDIANSHVIVVSGFASGKGQTYSIHVDRNIDEEGYRCTLIRSLSYFPNAPPDQPTRLAVAGSGSLHLLRDRAWKRQALRIVHEHDRGRVSSRTVSDWLAASNFRVSNSDFGVGPRCAVLWRHRTGGGGHEFYTGTTTDNHQPMMPTVAGGMDVSAIIGALIPNLELLAAKESFELDSGVAARLASLPTNPDERLT